MLAKLLIGATFTFGSLSAYSQVCETETINGSTANGAACQVEIFTKVSAAAGGSSNSICVENRSLEGIYRVATQVGVQEEEFTSAARFVGNTSRPRISVDRTEGYQYDDILNFTDRSFSINKLVDVFKVEVTQNVGYTSTRFGEKIDSFSSFSSVCLF